MLSRSLSVARVPAACPASQAILPLGVVIRAIPSSAEQGDGRRPHIRLVYRARLEEAQKFGTDFTATTIAEVAAAVAIKPEAAVVAAKDSDPPDDVSAVPA